MFGPPDDDFVFDFSDGSRLTLTVRTISGTYGVGYYMGRLVAARGTVAGTPVDVSDPVRLAFFGSTRSWSEMAIPTLVVRTSDRGESCGLVLDSSQWDTAAAIGGYVAHHLTCDERRGAELPLREVSWPERYQLP